jgi:hypothetical protein
MPFSWAGAAAGVQNAIRQREQDALAASELEMRRQALAAQLAGQEADRQERRAEREDVNRRADETRRLANAKTTAELLTPGEVTPQQAGNLKGTPYGDVLLEDRQTLRSRTIADLGGADLSSEGGRPYSLFTGTPEQRADATQRARRQQVLADPNLPKIVGRLVQLRDAGINLPNPESLMTPAERAEAQTAEDTRAFTEYQRRAELQNDLVTGRQQAAADRRRVATPRPSANAPLPRGIQNYLADMRQRGYTREQATAEVMSIWPKLLQDHPELDVERVQRGITSVFPAPTNRLVGNLVLGGRATGAGGRASGPAPVPSHPAAAAPAGRTASRADVQAVAQKRQISEAEARQQLEAAGVSIKD